MHHNVLGDLGNGHMGNIFMFIIYCYYRFVGFPTEYYELISI